MPDTRTPPRPSAPPRETEAMKRARRWLERLLAHGEAATGPSPGERAARPRSVPKRKRPARARP
jgi:hypothetical protein